MAFHSSSVTVDVAPSGAVSVVGIGVSLSARPEAILKKVQSYSLQNVIPLGGLSSSAGVTSGRRVASLRSVKLQVAHASALAVHVILLGLGIDARKWRVTCLPVFGLPLPQNHRRHHPWIHLS